MNIKFSIVVAVFSFLLLSSGSALAASSGACSGHDGVMCSAGNDSDGSVICNDGWKDSSVQYSEVKEVCGVDYLDPGPFYDVTQYNVNRTAILYLYDKAVISGYPDGTFKPENTVNRAELLKILVGGKGITPSVSEYNNCFPDVTDEWFAPYVCYAKTEGWVQGYSDNTFKPAQEVNKVEAIKMLVNSQNYSVPETVTKTLFTDVTSSEWYAPFLKVAKDMGLLEETGNYFYPASSMSRAEISENIYRAMIVNLEGLSSFEEYQASQ